MKILVACKRVVDFTIKIRVKSDFSDIETANVKMSMNPFDEIAVEEAVRLKEKHIANEVVVVTIGSAVCQDILRVALAMGADRALLIKTDNLLEPLNIAKVLKAIVLKESPQLVILGKQAIDDDCNQTGQMLAGLLNWPQGTFASKLVLKDSKAEVTREVDAGLEMLSLELPAVITTDLRLNEPGYPSLPNIMKAKQKPLDIIPLETLNVTINSHLKIMKVEPPLPKKPGIKVKSVSELIDKLKNEAKVL